jgi:site-specific recombinase XerC
MSPIAPTLESFFAERLAKQRRVSPRTIASYRDSLKLLLAFAWQQTGKSPSALDWADLDAELIGAFLDHLETQRHNTIRTRNLRLTAIRPLARSSARSARGRRCSSDGTSESAGRDADTAAHL